MTDQGVAWIAGVGAREGLGAALARRFAKEGLVVAVTGRTPERLREVVADVRGAGGEAFTLPADVSQEAEVVAAAQRVAERGRLSLAVFNAASAVWAPSLELTVQQFQETFRVTTLGGFIFGREALRLQVARGAGTLIFTGATASLRGKPPFAAFASAKAGLRSLSQAFAREFGPRGVHVAHVVIDGGIDGERLRTRNPQRFAERGADGLLNTDELAETYWQLHQQGKSAWTQELDVRPYNEPF
jgi:NAD(P)-dependent dehydrogenase (short-subunit alcohol dehydrogenase family)